MSRKPSTTQSRKTVPWALTSDNEMRFARDVAPSVVFMHQGQLIEKGPPGQIFEAPKMEETRKFLRRALPG